MLVFLSLMLISAIMVSSNWQLLDRLLYVSEKAIDSGDNLTAAVAIAQAAHYSQKPAEMLERAGLLAHQAGEHETAFTFLKDAREAGGLSPEGFAAMGDISNNKGDKLSAIRYWQAALNSSLDVEIYPKLIHVYQENEDWESAIQAQQALVSLTPNDPDQNYRLGLMLAASKPEASLAYLTLAAEINPAAKSSLNPFIRSLRSALNSEEQAYPFVIAGQELSALNEWELADIAFSNAVEINPDFADAWAYLGEARQQTGSDGYDELRTALEIEPDSVPANTLMALHWQRQNRYDLALVYLYAAAQLDEKNPALQAEIGNTLAVLGNISSAEVHYQRAVDLAPKNPTYWRALANYYIRHEIDLREKAAAAARRAVLLNPEDPQALDLLAQVYVLQENSILARRFLEKALRIDDKFAPAHLHFGLVNIIEGDHLRAYQHFSAAAFYSAPGSPIELQAERLLETHFP